MRIEPFANHHRLPAGAKAPAQFMKVRSSGLLSPRAESASADFHVLRRGIYPPAHRRRPRAQMPAIYPPADHRRPRAESALADFHVLRRGIYPPAHRRCPRAKMLGIHPPADQCQPSAEITS